MSLLSTVAAPPVPIVLSGVDSPAVAPPNRSPSPERKHMLSRADSPHPSKPDIMSKMADVTIDTVSALLIVPPLIRMLQSRPGSRDPSPPRGADAASAPKQSLRCSLSNEHATDLESHALEVPESPTHSDIAGTSIALGHTRVERLATFLFSKRPGDGAASVGPSLEEVNAACLECTPVRRMHF